MLSDRKFLTKKYRLKMGKPLDLNSPVTFNEKLQWLKLYDRKDIYSKMVDKYEVKEYVSKIIGDEYIIPTLGVYDNFDEIDFSKLPKQFVIKCTHDSGGLVICKDKSKLNVEEAKLKINKSLKTNYYYCGREWPYKNVKPRIIVEEFISNKNSDVNDYKFFCSNGKVFCFKIDFDRFINHRANYYDVKGNLLRFGEEVCPPDFNRQLKLPVNLKKMVDLAKILSKNIAFLRVDFYEVNNKILFGELTFFPAGGMGKFIPEEWDKKLGDFIDLSMVKKNEK